MLIKKLLTAATFISISIFSVNIFAAQTPIISQDELVKLMFSQDTANFIVLDVIPS